MKSFCFPGESIITGDAVGELGCAAPVGRAAGVLGAAWRKSVEAEQEAELII